LHLQRACGCWV